MECLACGNRHDHEVHGARAVRGGHVHQGGDPPVVVAVGVGEGLLGQDSPSWRRGIWAVIPLEPMGISVRLGHVA